MRGFRSARGAQVVPPPARVRIPVIGVDSPLQRLGRNADDTVEVPRRWGLAGWFARGPRPGEPGPALILGHVDSRAGPAVFHQLRALRSGDEIIVQRRSGPSARFVVQRLEHHDKERFPTKAVYFPTLEPTLRLVTCGGPFDASVGHYRDNVIVFAALAR
ncbi:MAG: class F sortase [Actinomycetota bacterium]|nr:class F sortase [Actinomycetota bacterium]